MKEKNWSGNYNSIYKTLGASNHTDKKREENDYYATEPMAVDVLMDVETFNHNIWECACGENHMANRIQHYGYDVWSTDLMDRGVGADIIDFLKYDKKWNGDIITNPPYKYGKEFAYKGIDLLENGNKLALFLKIQFLEGKARKKLFTKFPPKIIYVSSSRLLCAKNGEFEYMKDHGGSAFAHAWFVWEKGFIGDTILRWIN